MLVDVLGNEFIENGWAVKIMANSEGSTVSGNQVFGNNTGIWASIGIHPLSGFTPTC